MGGIGPARQFRYVGNAPMPKITKKTQPIVLNVPLDLLREIDRLGANPADRHQLFLEAIRAYLLRRQDPTKVTKAISESTATHQTGRYEPER